MAMIIQKEFETCLSKQVPDLNRVIRFNFECRSNPQEGNMNLEIEIHNHFSSLRIYSIIWK
jgi:hypothetical protein